MSLRDRVTPEEIEIRQLDNGRHKLFLDGEEITGHELMHRTTAEAHTTHPYVLAAARQARLTKREYVRRTPGGEAA